MKVFKKKKRKGKALVLDRIRMGNEPTTGEKGLPFYISI